MKNPILLACLFVVSFFLLAIPISALEYGGIGGKPANPNPDNPRTKSVFIFELEPGKSDSDELIAINNTAEKKNLIIYSTDSQKSTDGSFACEQLSDPRDNVGKWINLEKEITLEPSTNTKIPFDIKVPDNVSVGEHNGCIMIQEKKDSDVQSGVSLSFRTGLRVVVTIPGEQVRKLEFKSFEVAPRENGNIISTIQIANLGNVSIDTHIKLNVNGLLGTNIFNADNEYPILRGETSQYNFEVPQPYWGGFFTFTTSAEYDPSQDASVGVDSSNANTVLTSESKSLFIMPQIGALIIEVLVIGLGIGIIIYIKKKKSEELAILTSWVDYRVKEGEDIQSIAERFGISWKQLVKYNKLKPPYSLEKGKVIKTPSLN